MELKCCVFQCDQKFYSLNSYRTHLRIIYSFNKKYNDYYCTYENCRTSFKNAGRLLKHLNSQYQFPKDTKSNALNNQTQIIDTPSEISVDDLANIHHASKGYTNNPNEEIFSKKKDFLKIQHIQNESK
ncbi:hypothetical protein PVAND_006908 [Polypedilum vanderplanki]|uniref:C2H2-type domain-containing protein n=1 Tax=Polypedilum vanderplanki TaxID=319348 RepID=A0A9J6C695_POLVA|nr:hypothetical protein PVAND_006908 [Polypedilum vanderplanki]